MRYFKKKDDYELEMAKAKESGIVENKYSFKQILYSYPENEIATLKELHRIELFKKISKDIKDNEYVAVQFESSIQYANPSEDIKSPPQLITTLNVAPIVNNTMNINPKTIYKKHTSFWEKIKLVFSKKPIYTEG